MSVPLIEQQGSGVGSSSDSTVQTTTTATADGQAAAAAGPSLSISFSDGATVTLGVEDLQVCLLAIQTLLLLYVTYREVTN